jgi:hypothetical protein
MNVNSRFTGRAATFHPPQGREKPRMPVLLYVALALGAFALFALTVEGCERL